MIQIYHKILGLKAKRTMVRTQVHHRSIGSGKIKKMAPKVQTQRQDTGTDKTGWTITSGRKIVGIVTQRDHVHYRTNGQRGAGILALKDYAHHRTIGPRKAGITTLINRSHQRTIGKIEDKDGKLQALKDRGDIAVTGKGTEERILV